MRSGSKTIVIDIDSSVSPTHGEQEGSSYNGHFACTCYHPLFVFNQFGDLKRCVLRPGHVHSAEGWRELLEPVVARYRDRAGRRYFRADAAFAAPEVYKYLEAEGFLYAIRLPGNQVLQRRISHLLTRPVGRPPKSVRRYYYSFDYQAQSWDRTRRVVAKIEWHPGELIPRFGFVVTNLNRSAERVTAFYNQPRQGGAVDQGRQARNQVDAALLSEVPCQRGAAPAARLGLQPGQLHAHAGAATGDRALVADDAQGEAGENRCPHGAPRPLRHLPDGRGRGLGTHVRANPRSDRPPAGAAGAGVT